MMLCLMLQQMWSKLSMFHTTDPSESNEKHDSESDTDKKDESSDSDEEEGSEGKKNISESEEDIVVDYSR